MSSTSDAYQYLLVQTLPKSILKKSPSPRFSAPLEHEQSPAANYGNIDNQSPAKSILFQSAVDEPIMTWDEAEHRPVRTVPCADSSSSSSSSLFSDVEQHKRLKTRTKRVSTRPATMNGAGSSSTSSGESSAERQVKRSMAGSKLTGLCADKQPHKDMQLDEFMRKYQQQGGIHVPARADHADEQTSAANPSDNDGNNYQQSSITHHRTARAPNDADDDDENDDDGTRSFLTTMNTISRLTRTPSPLPPSLLSSQLLLDVARTDQCDRRTKIDHLRQYVEEQTGISAFLTIYKLIKSSQIPIDIRQKPFCHYAKFLPHLCCLIMLESEEQSSRV